MTTTPTKNESLPELVARWRAEADAATNPENTAFLRGCINGTRTAAAELEAALTREAPTEAVPSPSNWLTGILACVPTAVLSNAMIRRIEEEARRAMEHDAQRASAKQRAATPPAPQRMEKGGAYDDGTGRHRDYSGATQPTNQDRGEVSRTQTQTVDLEQFRPSVKAHLTQARTSLLKVGSQYPEHYRSVLEEEVSKVSGLLDIIDAAALTEAKQQGSAASLDPFVALRDKWGVRSGALTYDLAASQLDEAIEEAKQQGPGEAVYLIESDFGLWKRQTKAEHDWWEGKPAAPDRLVLYKAREGEK